MLKIIYTLAVTLSLSCVSVIAQIPRRHLAFEEYIHKHHKEALRQMERYGIPASITMAQGLVESAAGRSPLARDFNNHFGIKCHSSWQGRRTYKSDDAPNECFRHYNTWQESYEDHSLFLKAKRYANLFSLDRNNYRAWAKGLQTMGYATDRGYANKLIQVIETYELYAFDNKERPLWMRSEPSSKSTSSPRIRRAERTVKRTIYQCYGLRYVLANTDDSLEYIAEDIGISLRRLALYNDAPRDIRLQKGDVVYLERKLRRAKEPYLSHLVEVGDSMHSIAQRYGLQLSRLYHLNRKDGDYIPEEGDTLRLR